MPGPDQPVKLQHLLLNPPQLSPECQETRASYLRNSLIVWIGYDIEQLLDPVAPDRCNDSELGKMGPDRIDHRGLLTDEQVARAVQHQAALLLRSLGRHEPHGRAPHRLTDCLRVGGIVLMALDVGLHILRWHQTDLMAQLGQLACPMVRRGTGLHADQAWRQSLEERRNLAAAKLLSDDDLLGRVNAVNLKHVFGDIQTDRGNLHVDGSPDVIRLRRTTLWHLDAGSGRRPPHQTRKNSG